jgi:fatty-acid desaturase
MTGKQQASQADQVMRMTTGGSVLIGENQHARAYFRRVLVLIVVIGPFLATAFAIVQLWDRAVNWRDLVLFVGLYVPISLRVTAGFHRTLTHRSS